MAQLLDKPLTNFTRRLTSVCYNAPVWWARLLGADILYASGPRGPRNPSRTTRPPETIAIHPALRPTRILLH
jgi:hypothetical protein